MTNYKIAKMRQNCFWLLLVFMTVTATAQQSSIDFYGFVRNDAYVDTYKGVNAVKDMFYLFPNYAGVDGNGKDFNEVTSANLLSIGTRMGLNVGGPEVFGAKTSAKLEFDFIGKPTFSVFRMRHAYVVLKWENSDLLIGQSWHPLFGGGAYPRIVNFNTGAPFQPFNRSPQTRFNYHLKNVTLSATASYDLQFLSKGPEGSSDQYKRDGVVPDLTLNIAYKSDNFNLGAASSFRTIKPRTKTFNDLYVSEDFSTAFTHTVFCKVTTGDLMVTAKTTLSQNGSHLLMLGGYGVSRRDSTTGREEYTNYNTLASFVNVVYGKATKVGLFAGYSKNLGTSDALFKTNGDVITWGLGQSIQEMYRTSVFATKKVNNFQLGVSYEITTANFGVGSINFEDGLYSEIHEVTNHRGVISVVYFF